MDEPSIYLLRVWLPDRPGALGAVASRLGALRGDVTGLEIVERGGGRVIDEIVVTLPDDVSIDLILREVAADDDVEVEDIRPLERSAYDPQLDVLEAAAILLGAETRDRLAEALAEHVVRAVQLDWACVLERPGGVLASWGDRPNDRWLDGFVAGSPGIDFKPSSPGGSGRPGHHVDPLARADAVDALWTPLPAADAALVVGRDTAIRHRERQRLAALARIADAWFRRLKERDDRRARALHPAGSGA